MEPIYLNDPNGLKESKLSNTQIDQPERLFEECRSFLCDYLVDADPSRTFFGQNMGTHAAHIASIVVNANPAIQKIIISDHEIRWLKEMFEIPGYEPHSTHSNYRQNDPVQCPILPVTLAGFSSYADTVCTTAGPAIFYVSHVSRFTGEIQDIEQIYELVRKQSPESILIVDGAQALGVTPRVHVNDSCDAYIGMSSKFLGAEPNLGFAFLAENLAKKYDMREKYPAFDPNVHDKDLYSLRESLQHLLYRGDFASYITDLKEYAIQKIREVAPERLFVFPTQSPGFLTLDFGSKEKNEEFVAFAAEQGVIVSDNANDAWSIIPAPKPLVRVGLSVRTAKDHIDRLAEIIQVKS